MRLNDFQISPNFNLCEFQCPCCHAVIVHRRLVVALQKLRDSLSRPITITSGYRCAPHNKAVGGVKGSLHMRGLAADVAAAPEFQETLRAKAAESGFSRTIAYPARFFVHMEVSDG